MRFDGAAAIISTATETQLVVLAPQHQPGHAKLTVTAGGRTSNEGDFEYQIATGGSDDAGKNYLPAPNHTYTYHTSSATSAFDYSASVLDQRDSADCHVTRLKVVLPTTTLVQRMYVSPASTVYQMTASKETYDAYNNLTQLPNFVSGVLEGMNIDQVMPRTPDIGDVVVFQGGPNHMRTVISDGADHEITNDFKQYFVDGRVLGYENITTPAGSFDHCLKWTYQVHIVQTLNDTPLVDKYLTRTLWYYPGIGPVRDVETGDDGTTITQLMGKQ